MKERSVDVIYTDGDPAGVGEVSLLYPLCYFEHEE